MSKRSSHYETRTSSQVQSQAGSQTTHIALDQHGDLFIVNPPSKFTFLSINVEIFMFSCCTCNTSVKYYFLLQLNQEDGQGEEEHVVAQAGDRTKNCQAGKVAQVSRKLRALPVLLMKITLDYKYMI